jgi:hypothetical protein
VPKQAPARPERKAERPTITDDLTGKFLRVGNKLYRTSDTKKPIVRLEPDRLVTSNIDALPDILRIAKANGWTTIKINGGDKFKQAAFLAAAAQGLDVEGYRPSKLLQAEADRLRARITARDVRREKPMAANKPPREVDEASRLKLLAERFLAQTSTQNAHDPELRKAQGLVTQAVAIAQARYPREPAKLSKQVEASRQEVAAWIASGNRIAVTQQRNLTAQRTREVVNEKTQGRDGRSR